MNVYQTKENDYKKESEIMPESAVLNNLVRLSDYDNSLNFIVGMANREPDFDVLDNPYFEFVGYEMTPSEDGQINLENKFELEKCSE